jgi:peptidoglycan/LPS O-acetylase OafA/YrhL
LALVLLSASWSSAAIGHGPLGVIASWIQNTLQWNLHVLDRTSGMVQHLFKSMPPGLRLPFVAGYGVFQPVLPAALIEPTIALWRIVGTLRALGWYLLLPLLVYGVIAALRTEDKRQRRVWLWLEAAVWLWILVSALRGGGDQWDNPRYRVILLPWLALVAGYALTFWLAHRDRWLPRILALELVFLLTFTLWYGSRYYRLPLFNFWGYVIIVLIVGGMLLAADILRELKGRRPPH